MGTLPSGFISRAAGIVGGPFVLQDAAARDTYGTDGTKQTARADLVILPGSTQEVSQVAKLCNDARVPIVARGAGTGYTGGAVPTRGGIVLSLERMNRILEIDQVNLLARVQPNVITGDLQDAVEKVGLFYPPDPASLRQSALGGNVAECAGGPRAFKYGTTKRYVLALEAVLASGEIVHTGSKAVKNVVGYDLTQLLVGSEGTLAIITEITLRLIPLPQAHATLLAEFADITHAVNAVTQLIQRRVVPAAVELIDAPSLKALADHAGRPIGTPGAGAALIVEVDGSPESVGPEMLRVEDACRAAHAVQLTRAASEAERDEIWNLRRELSPALKKISTLKLNNDVVVPRGRIPELFALVKEIEQESGLPIASFGHAGDGNIHVNIMLPSEEARSRGEQAVRRLFEGVVALEGSISGEHGIGFTKAPHLGLELSPEAIALMKRVKAAFDPNGILNPGKIFPDG
ncbi:MAG TPA: FAD-linked oxidase C-terminal domain-containing protein [Vicinamibacterales bacterium]|nr:FAD-linked oxidase C-terminal domain-containing protein [Vicinamibacterales bacterium]